MGKKPGKFDDLGFVSSGNGQETAVVEDHSDLGFVPLKKKDESVVSPGSEEFSTQSEQQSKPLENPITPEKERDPIETLKRTAFNTFRYQLPADLIGGQMAFEKAPQQIAEGTESINPFVQMDKAIGGDKKEVTSDLPDWLKKTLSYFTHEPNAQEKVVIEQRRNAPNPADVRRKTMLLQAYNLRNQGEKANEGLVNSLDKAEDWLDYVNWAASAFGQAVGQIPAAVLTKGATAYGQEIGTIYLDGVQKLAQEKGVTPEEIIRTGQDEAIYPLIFGMAAGKLETIGAKGVMNSFGKKEVMNSVRSRALGFLKSAGSKEALTEGSQSVLEQLGVSKAAGKTWGETFSNIDPNDIKESMAQGFVGGQGLHSVGEGYTAAKEKIKDSLKPKTPTDVIREQVGNITSSTDAATIENAAEKIQDKVDEEQPTENEPFVKPKKQNSQEEIDAFVEKMKRGDDRNTPEDIQFYENNKEAIESQLRSSVHQTQPKEGEQNAISVGSTKEVSLGQTPGNSEEVGGGIPGAEKPAGTQKEVTEGKGEAPVINNYDELNALKKDIQSGKVKMSPAELGKIIVDLNAKLDAEEKGKPKKEIAKEDKGILDQFDEDGSFDDLADNVESLDADHPQYEQLQDAVKEFRDAQQEDKTKYGLRGDPDQYGNAFADKVKKILSTESKQVEVIQDKEGEAMVFDAKDLKNKQKVFVYGTLQDPKTRKQALGEDIDTTKQTVTGKTKEDIGDGYSTIVSGPGRVEGQVMELSPEQIAKLDKYESKYERKEITLDNGEKAYAYHLKEQYIPKTNKELNNQISAKESELAAAQTAFEEKAKQLDKELAADQENLFGERKAQGGMFDVRANPEQRGKILAPMKAKIMKLKTELGLLKGKLKTQGGQLEIGQKEETKKDRKERLLTKTANSIRERVLQYFAGGGKIDTESMKDETGFGAEKLTPSERRRRAKEEYNKRKSLRQTNGPSMDDIVLDLMQSLPENTDEDDVRNEIIDVLNSHATMEDMMTDLDQLDKSSDFDKMAEEYYAGVEQAIDEVPEEKAQDIADRIISEFDGANDEFDMDGAIQSVEDGEFDEFSDIVTNVNQEIQNVRTQEAASEGVSEGSSQGSNQQKGSPEVVTVEDIDEATGAIQQVTDPVQAVVIRLRRRIKALDLLKDCLKS